jgi:hypothetical protein
MTIKTTSEVCRFARWRWCATAAGLLLTLGATALPGEIHLDVLKTRTDSFTNVTVYSRSQTDIFIRHSRGIANVKLENLNPEIIARLNSGDAPSGTATTAKSAAGAKESETPSNATNTTAAISYSKLNTQIRQQMMSGVAALSAMSAVRVSPVVVAMVLGVLLAAYLFICYCLKLICQKTANEPGILIWLPILQMLPLLRAAGMSGWCFLGLFVPVVNLIVQIVWCFKIVKVRGKSVWTAIGLLLPVTNLAALLYLAFSDGKSDESSGNRKVTLAAGPLPVEA